MAGDAVVGALRVVLGTDTASFEDGLKSASASLNQFAKDAASTAAGIELAKLFEELAKSALEFIKTAVETGNVMEKMSQRIGVPVESLSSLTTAAALSDVGLQELGNSMGKLAKNMAAAASGGVGPAASAFHYLGLTAKDLKAASPEDVLNRMADAFSTMKDGADKTAVAIAIFGRAGQQMIPLLNLGTKGLEEMKQEALALGLVIGDSTAKQSAKFVDATKLMGMAVQGVGNVVAAYFIPSLANAAAEMVHWVAQGGYVNSIAEVIIRTIVFLGDNLKALAVIFGLVFGRAILAGIVALGLAFLNLAVYIAAAAAATVTLIAPFLAIASAVAAVVAGVLYLTGTLDAAMQIGKDFAANFSLTPALEFLGTLLTAVGIDVTAFTKNLDGLKKSADEADKTLKALIANKFDPNESVKTKAFTDEINKLTLQTKELQGQFLTIGPNFVQAAIKAKLFADESAAVGFTIEKMTPQMQQLSTALFGVFKAQLWKDQLTPMQQYEQQILRLNAAFPAGQKAMETYQIASLQAWAKMQQTYADMAATFVGGFAQLFQAFGQKNKQMFEIGKALAIAEATIAAYAGAAKALATYPPPLSYAMAAAAVAAGLANVVKISQVQFTGAKGGQFMVGGGVMGVDTKMVSMALAPGELVDVTPADQVRSGGGQPQEITVSGIRPGDLFTGDMVRGMFNALNQGYSDGYRVKFA